MEAVLAALVRHAVSRPVRWRPFPRCNEYIEKVRAGEKKLGLARAASPAGGKWGRWEMSQKRGAADERKLASLLRSTSSKPPTP